MQLSTSLHTLLAKRQLGENISFGNFTRSHIKSNISGNNCTRTTFNTNSKIKALFTKGNLAATLHKNGTVKLWDLEQKICRWTLPSDINLIVTSGRINQVFNMGIIKIVEGNLVYVETKYYTITYPNRSLNSHSIKNLIRIVDLETGKEKGRIDDPLINSRLIDATCKNIFCFINDGEQLKKWDFSGKLIETISSKKLLGINQFILASEKFLAHVADSTLIVHDIDTGSYKEINLNCIPIVGSSITCATIYNSDLLCGFYTQNDGGSILLCCSLISGAVVRYGLRQYKSSPNHYIKNIVVYNYTAYLDCSDGTLSSISILQNTLCTSIPLKTQSSDDLCLDNGLLVTFSIKHKMKVWDLNTCIQIKIKEMKGYKNFQFTEGKILATSNKCMMQWDYLHGSTDAGERPIKDHSIDHESLDTSNEDTTSYSDSDSDVS